MDRDQELIFEAKLCEQCELYDEMKEKMRELVMLRPQLETEERNLLSVAYRAFSRAVFGDAVRLLCCI